jgi:hypothetical protein
MAIYTTIVVRVNSTIKLIAVYVFHITKSTDHIEHFQLEKEKRSRLLKLKRDPDHST